jgi:hypothetical protein
VVNKVTLNSKKKLKIVSKEELTFKIHVINEMQKEEYIDADIQKKNIGCGS